MVAAIVLKSGSDHDGPNDRTTRADDESKVMRCRTGLPPTGGVG
jgi:hypothetical protein